MHKSSRPHFGSIRVKTPLAFPGERIGIMGGSFNPPHAGHATVSRTALKRLGLSRIWWVVTPGNPLKANGGLTGLTERMDACRKLARRPREIVTGFEAELGTSYTAATLAFLRLRHPGVRFVWVMGADNLAGFHRWQQWPTIPRQMPMIVIDRPGWRWKALASPAARRFAPSRLPEQRAGTLGRQAIEPTAKRNGAGWSLVSTRLSDLSSTELRNRGLGVRRDRSAQRGDAAKQHKTP